MFSLHPDLATSGAALTNIVKALTSTKERISLTNSALRLLSALALDKYLDAHKYNVYVTLPSVLYSRVTLTGNSPKCSVYRTIVDGAHK